MQSDVNPSGSWHWFLCILHRILNHRLILALIAIHLSNNLRDFSIKHRFKSLFSHKVREIRWQLLYIFDNPRLTRHRLDILYVLPDDLDLLLDRLAVLHSLSADLCNLTKLRLQRHDLPFCVRYLCFHRGQKLGEVLVEVKLEFTSHRIVNILGIIVSSREFTLRSFAR
jgi:hypothetical protein